MREQRRHLRVLVPVAVDVADPVTRRLLADAEPATAEDGRARSPRSRRPSPPGRAGVGRRTARAGRRAHRRHRATAVAFDPACTRRSRSTSTNRPALNQTERKTGKRLEALQDVDKPRPEDRVVARVEPVHRRGVVAGRAEREVGQLLEGHADRREDRQRDDLDDGEVDRREQSPEAPAEPGERIVGVPVVAGAAGRGSRSDGGRRRDGAGPDAPAAAVAVRRSDAVARARSKSSCRSSRSSRPTETRNRPGVIPASRSSASVIWRCDVDGGWTTIVWTLPSEAVSSVSVSASITPSTGVAAAGELERSIPPATPSRNWRAATSCWGWLGRPGYRTRCTPS